jgi:hypothetical protein
MTAAVRGAGTTPFVVRIASGDIASAQATLLVVNHMNGLDPSGAEASVDAALGGAIARRAARGALDGRFGASHFLPAATAPLAASAVLVLGLGDPDKFTAERLPELGAALVEAVAALGIRDAATVVHGGGAAAVDPERATRLLMDGLLQALEDVPGATRLRELTLVEQDEAKLPAIERGVAAARGSPRVHVYQDVVALQPPAVGQARLRGATADTLPDHLRIGITRAGPCLKVTVIGQGSFDVAGECPFPGKLADQLLVSLKNEVLVSDDRTKRAEALRSIGYQLAENFLWAANLALPDLPDRVDAQRSGYLVLRLDRWTVDLPWEIAMRQDKFLSRSHLLSRQLEINAPGRPAVVRPTAGTLRVLVVGDPTGDLQAAHQEAEAVAARLEELPGAEVRPLIGGVTYQDVSRELDTTRYDILHYAGHARFDREGYGRGGLVLADDQILTPEDLSTRRYLPNVVFANACQSAETGVREDPFGGGKQTVDLVTGLLRAGVRGFVGSAWRVGDEAARTFAESFYGALAGSDQQDPRHRTLIGAAVADARRAVIHRHGEGEPAWAAYALYGSPWLVVP